MRFPSCEVQLPSGPWGFEVGTDHSAPSAHPAGGDSSENSVRKHRGRAALRL